MITGTLINTATVLAGGTAGTLLGDRVPPGLRRRLIDAVGLFSVYLGLKLALQADSAAVLLLSLLLGGLAGDLLALDARLEAWGRRWEERLPRLAPRPGAGAPEPSPLSANPGGVHRSARSGGDFVRGLVTASLVFCVGPLAVVGSLQDGLTGDYRILAVKAVMDGFTSLTLAASFGAGVLGSAAVVLGFQGGLSLLASLLKPLLTEQVIAAMTGAGGLLILAIGIELLDLRKMRVANYLPALALAPVLAALAARL